MLFTVNGYPNHAFLTTNGHIVFYTWVKSGERQICLQPLVDDFVMGLCYTSDDLNSGIIFVTNKSVSKFIYLFIELQHTRSDISAGVYTSNSKLHRLLSN